MAEVFSLLVDAQLILYTNNRDGVGVVEDLYDGGIGSIEGTRGYRGVI